MTVELIPALDLRKGQVVRLAQGDYARETAYAVDPLDQARRYRQWGARRLHVVNLDGARAGGIGNLRLIESIAGLGLAVQAGGGVRQRSDLLHLFDAGVERAVIGSVALTDPECAMQWIGEFGADRVVIALDTRKIKGRWSLAASGWIRRVAATLDDLLLHFEKAGARHVLCTDIARDGMLQGPNAELYRHVSKLAPRLHVQASGGIRDTRDLELLDGFASAAIVGRSLLEGQFKPETVPAC